MAKKLIQLSHPGRKTFKKLYEQEKFVKLTQDQFFAESETVYTRSQTRLAIIPQSLIVNHNVMSRTDSRHKSHLSFLEIIVLKKRGLKIDRFCMKIVLTIHWYVKISLNY